MMPLAEMAEAVLRTADGREKTALSRKYAAQWFSAREAGERPEVGRADPPLHPARPAQPELLSPRHVPRRRPGTPEGRAALLHAVAHIELNAVDLHWDVIARFSHVPLPLGFYDDWVKAADDESKHFNLMCDCLEEMGSYYGALPAHAGMWRAAEDTVDDLMGRLAVVPMVLEARGLDVTPGMIEIFRKAKADSAVAALETIYAEEVAHVAYGSKWFHFLCGRHDDDPKDRFHALVRKYFHGDLKPPFNEEKRAEAGIPPDFYWPLTADGGPS
ncbi:ferritin-like domain-containing protein [Sulfitobacter sp. 1A15299]|uniref:ferritin-like domain-containing protein n=1 Tax=Sulfitobacter sp. 1A15299 TaxID=3368598 RepID=UPI003746FDB0